MPDKAAADFFSLALQYGPIRSAEVEINGYQRTLKWHIEQEMLKKRTFVPINAITSKTAKSNRIISTIAGVLHYGHLYVHKSMTQLVEQLDEYDGSDSCNDDTIDALSIALLALNPALRLLMSNMMLEDDKTISGDFTIIDEREYKELTFGGCP